MDVRSGAGYPASALSNFARHPFEMDGVKIASMEGFLQSLKFDKPHIQNEVCKMSGLAAKLRGKPRNRVWTRLQRLWWQGKPYPRESDEYQALLDRAYQTMCEQNSSFRKALLASGDAIFTHNMGSHDPTQTVLTPREFTERLRLMRLMLRRDQNAGSSTRS